MPRSLVSDDVSWCFSWTLPCLQHRSVAADSRPCAVWQIRSTMSEIEKLQRSLAFFRYEVRAGARAHSSNESAAQGHSDHVLCAGVRSEFRARRRGGGASAHRPVEPSQASPPLGCSVHRGWLRSWPWSWVTRRRCSGGLGHHRGSGRGRQVHLGHLGVDRDAGPQGGR